MDGRWEFLRELSAASERLTLTADLWAEEASPDGWPKPRDVELFATLFGVPVTTLGGLVGLLKRRADYYGRFEAWLDAARHPEEATRHLIKLHDDETRRAFGWFCGTTDLGWLTLREAIVR